MRLPVWIHLQEAGKFLFTLTHDGSHWQFPEQRGQLDPN